MFNTAHPHTLSDTCRRGQPAASAIGGRPMPLWASCPPWPVLVMSTAMGHGANNANLIPTILPAGTGGTHVPKVQQLQPALGQRQPVGGVPGAQPGGQGGQQHVHGIYTRDMAAGGAGRQDLRPRYPGAAAQQPRHRVHRAAVLPAHRHRRRTPSPPAAITSRCGDTSLTMAPRPGRGPPASTPTLFGTPDHRRQQARRRPGLLVLRGPRRRSRHLTIRRVSRRARGDRRHHHRVQGQLHGGRSTARPACTTATWRTHRFRSSEGSLEPAGGTSPVVLIANNTVHYHSRHDHGVRLHRPAQRRKPPGGVRRLRQRGQPDARRHLPGTVDGNGTAAHDARGIGAQVPGETAEHLQPARRRRLLRRSLRGLLGRLGDRRPRPWFCSARPRATGTASPSATTQYPNGFTTTGPGAPGYLRP